MIVPRYLPGPGVAVVAEGCVALLPEGTLPSVLDAVWDVLRAGEGMDALLPLLTGSRSQGAFGLVEMSGPIVRAYLRGAVELEAVGGRALDSSTVVGEDSHLRAAGASDVPWVGVEWADVDEFTVRAAADAPEGATARRGTGYAALAGVVPAACVTVHLRVSLPASSIGGAAAAADAELEEELYGDTILTVSAQVRQDVAAARVRDEAAASSFEDVELTRVRAGSAAPPAEDDVEVTRLRVDRASEPTGASASAASPAGTVPPVPAPPTPQPQYLHPPTEATAPAEQTVPPEHTSPPEHTQPRLAAPAAPQQPTSAVPTAPSAQPAPATRPAGSRVRAVEDHDGETILSSDLVEIRRSLSSWAHPQVPGPFAVPTEFAPAKLVMSSGLVVTLDRAVLIGRAPVVSRVANRDLPRLVTVSSPHHDISRTHAQVVQEGQRVFVTDLDSTNGVVLHARGQAPQRVRPGVPIEIGPDATVDIGDGVTFRVVRS
ncbi:FHA domain-containing protein [Flavimobilis soli]|uniref:FHA domain-containing protein n=1 Tax=Flavimobilis soli TaxID=442709 RepID=A0A2A9ECE7_9MICO|nr:FHA domain-containing protein [Flavimobilis soli]PFG36473.1 FHA domain-containing protein [Flavimobilis soli]